MQLESITIPVGVFPQREISPKPLRPAANLSDPHERGELTPAALREFRRIADRWKLTEDRQLGLLGGVASSTYHAWRSHPEKARRLDQDTLTRISLIIGIDRALHSCFGDPWADTWVTNGNRAALFADQPPIVYMLREGLPGLLQIRRMVEGWSAGY